MYRVVELIWNIDKTLLKSVFENLLQSFEQYRCVPTIASPKTQEKKKLRWKASLCAWNRPVEDAKQE